jgi:hypothetical protein
MRRKAQAGFSMPMNQGIGADQLIVDFLKALPQATEVVSESPSTHQPIDLQPTAGKEPYSDMAQIVEHEVAVGEAGEAAAFDKLGCGLQCLEKGLALFEEYEAMEEREEKEGKGEKKEKAALKKINSLVEDMKKVYKDLVEAEVEEHDEKSEVEAKKEEQEEEVEVKEKKEASVKGFTRQASKKESFVSSNLRW